MQGEKYVKLSHTRNMPANESENICGRCELEFGEKTSNKNLKLEFFLCN